MSKSFRIRTNPGEDDGYLKVKLDLTQNYDFLEILSLKLTQVDDYQDFCSDYGVIAGKIDINTGFGLPNVKVSIFVPIDPADVDNPVISNIYPYIDANPAETNDKGIRYNLLPDQQQSLDHTPVGTFPEKRQILDNNTTLEIYEKYYKYTTTTNDAGDYILFGIPVGQHTLHYDVDLSDIGFLSQRPFEMMSQGYSEDLFDSRFKFKSSNNLSKLSQILSDNLEIDVASYWCDSLSVGSEIGINRKDISITQVEIIPTAIFLGSIISDDEKDSVNKNCLPDRDMGRMKEMITNTGKIEAIRRTVDGTIEKFAISTDAIDENGNWSIQLPMNIRKVITNEFGDLVPSPDGIKGVATEGDYRFKISMDKADTDKRLRQRAKFIVPNMNNNYHFKTYGYEELKGSNHFKINRQLSEVTLGTQYSGDTTNQYNYLDEFYSFRWKKVYTTRQYIGRFQKFPIDETRGFIGIKDISVGEGVNKFPSNRASTTVHPLYTALCILLTFIGITVAIINGVIMFVNGLITGICNIKLPTSMKLIYCFKIGATFCSQSYKDYCDLHFNTCTDGSNQCHKCKCNLKDGWDQAGKCGKKTNGEFSLLLGWKCIFGPLLCNKCGAYCPNKIKDPYGPYHSCCRSCSSGGAGNMGKWNCPPKGTSVTATYTGTPQQNKDWHAGCKGYYTSAAGQGYGDGDCKSYYKCNSPTFADVTHPAPSGTCCRLCCIKVPLIKLKCAEDPTLVFQHTLFKQPFVGLDCNKTYLGLHEDGIICKNCGGPQIRILKDWVSCVLEPVAVWLRMLKFDFYNDWVGGSLYFPLIKRKYKLKKRGRKFGQIKKDKFCQFNCAQIDKKKTAEARDNWWRGGAWWTGIPTIFQETFQGNDTGFIVHRIRLEKPAYTSPLITDSGCKFKMESDITTHWYGSQASSAGQDFLSAAKEIQLKGKNDADESCVIQFTSFAALQTFMTGYPSITLHQEEKTETGIYGEPNYILTEGQFGQDSWVNVGGNSLHKNICNMTFMLEREEYFKEFLDCPADYVAEPYLNLKNKGGIEPPAEDEEADASGGLSPPEYDGYIGDGGAGGHYDCIDNRGCEPDCGSNGVRACNLFCPCSNVTGALGEFIDDNGNDVFPPFTSLPGVDEYKVLISHGLVTWFNHEIFYTPIIPPPQLLDNGTWTDGDKSFNQTEYKANIMLPTTIMELGSSTFCDIDDAPFIMDTIPPTTYGVSYEAVKYKMEGDEPNFDVLKFKDKEGSINLSAYVEFGCIATVCFNASATVNGSQIGVTSIDKNDIGVEIDTCYMRFIHEPEVREYFCKRFNGFKNTLLDPHYMRPGSNVFENDYQTYQSMKLQESPQRTYTFKDQNQMYVSEYDDGDFFVPGDACGYYSYNSDWEIIGSITPDYFYGLAPGQTSGMVDFPNPTTINMAQMFGAQAHTSSLGVGVDVINPDTIPQGITVVEETTGDNGLQTIKGIRFNRSQTPYYLYFGLVPGRTALHKTVGKFFADKINAVTLEGMGQSDNATSETINNQNNIYNTVTNPYSIYRSCLGQTVVASDSSTGGATSSGGVAQPGAGTTNLPADPGPYTGPIYSGPTGNYQGPTMSGNIINTQDGNYCHSTNSGGFCFMTNALFTAQYPAFDTLDMGVMISNPAGGSLNISIFNDTADTQGVTTLVGGICKSTIGYIYIKDSNNNVVWESDQQGALTVSIPPASITKNFYPGFATTNVISLQSNAPSHKMWTVPLTSGIYSVHIDKSSSIRMAPAMGVTHPVVVNACNALSPQQNSGYITVVLTT